MKRTTSGTPLGYAFRLPTRWLVAAAGVLIPMLIAVFVFKMAVSAALLYGLIGLMVVSHLFMCGRHTARGDHAGQVGRQNTASNPAAPEQDRHPHAGGCH